MSSNDRAIEIISLNIRGIPFTRPSSRSRVMFLGSAFVSSRADVINLQEVQTYHLLRLLRSQLNFRFPYVNYERGLVGPAGGLVTFSRVPISGGFFVSLFVAARRETGSFKTTLGSLQRMHKGVLVSKLSGTSVTLVNVHLSANWSGDWSSAGAMRNMQRNELEAVANILESIGDKHGNIIISGDFNLSHRSALYAWFREENGLKDAFEGDARPTFHAHYLPSGRAPHRIDYVFLRPGRHPLLLEESHRLFTSAITAKGGHEIYVSDHVALGVKYRISPSE